MPRPTKRATAACSGSADRRIQDETVRLVGGCSRIRSLGSDVNVSFEVDAPPAGAGLHGAAASEVDRDVEEERAIQCPFIYADGHQYPGRSAREGTKRIRHATLGLVQFEYS